MCAQTFFTDRRAQSKKFVETTVLEEESLKNTQPPGLVLLFPQVILQRRMYTLGEMRVEIIYLNSSEGM